MYCLVPLNAFLKLVGLNILSLVLFNFLSLFHFSSLFSSLLFEVILLIARSLQSGIFCRCRLTNFFCNYSLITFIALG